MAEPIGCGLLTLAGTTDAEASNASDAFTVARREQPDLLVLDLTMPGGGSLGLVKKLQEQEDANLARCLLDFAFLAEYCNIQGGIYALQCLFRD